MAGKASGVASQAKTVSTGADDRGSRARRRDSGPPLATALNASARIIRAAVRSALRSTKSTIAAPVKTIEPDDDAEVSGSVGPQVRGSAGPAGSAEALARSGMPRARREPPRRSRRLTPAAARGSGAASAGRYGRTNPICRTAYSTVSARMAATANADFGALPNPEGLPVAHGAAILRFAGQRRWCLV